MAMRGNMSQITQGDEVYGSDNEKIGKVAEVGQGYFLVQKGMFFHKDMYLPTRAMARVDRGNVYLNVAKHDAENIATERLPAQGDAWYGTTATTSTAQRTMARGNEEIVVPVVEEQLRAGVREVEGGSARIVKDVITEQQSIDVPVSHEEVYVTERSVNRAATQADMDTMNREIDIPLTEQEVVTQKQAVVTGEVGIRKEVTTETERVSDTVRREEVHVEDLRNPHIHLEGDDRNKKRS